MTRQIRELARQIDVVHETDVLVERNGCFGGKHHAGPSRGLAWCLHEQAVDSEGIGIEFEERAKAMGAARPEPQSTSHALNAEVFKYVPDTLVREAGVRPMPRRLVVAPVMDGDGGYGLLILPTTCRFFQLPHRALLSRKVGNLIVAGRCIGGDKVSHAAVRNMLCRAVTGQAASAAAAMSVRDGEAFERIDVTRLQGELRRQGARIL